MQETALIENKQLREQAINRIDILEKVKKLFLIPQMDVMTIKQVAEYYGVDQHTLIILYTRHKDEIDSDGTELKSYRDFLMSQDVILEKVLKGKVIIRINESITLEVPNRGIRVFSQRAILRIGMLLRDSPVAKEVRTQLLNVLEASTPEQKTGTIEIEKDLQADLLNAIMNGDLEAETRAKTKIIAFQNRHIEALVKREQELIADNKALTGEILTWNDRNCLNKAIRIIAGIRGQFYGAVWNELYNELRYKYGIGLSQRGKPPYIQHIKESEWTYVQQSLSAICEDSGLSPSKVMKKAKMIK